MVGNGITINFPIIHYRSQSCVCLLDEKEGGGNWRVGFGNASGVQVLVEESSTAFHFFGCQWIDFCRNGSGCSFYEFDFVIPCSFWWESIEIFLGENFSKFRVFRWNPFR